MAAPVAAAVPWLAKAAPWIAQGVNFLGGLFGANRQQKKNKELAQFQHEKNMELLKYQLEYDAPKAQMARYLEAGLNPNLIYGSATPGNMSSPPQYPSVQPADYQSPYSSLGTKFQQSKLMEAQAGLTEAKTQESNVKQELMQSQEALVRSNPYLNPAYINAMVTNLKSIAAIKEQEAGFKLSKTQDDVTGVRWERGFLQMQRELDLLMQKYNMSEKDIKVKAEIIQSKEFENALKKIQVDWMKSGDMTPQHIYQGILMLLTKMM